MEHSFGYIGKCVACISCASVKESMRTAVCILSVFGSMVADLRDLNLGLARSLHGDLNWRGVHSNGRVVAKDLTRPNGQYIKSEYLYLYSKFGHSKCKSVALPPTY